MLLMIMILLQLVTGMISTFWLPYLCCPCLLRSLENSAFAKPGFPKPGHTNHQVASRENVKGGSTFNKLPTVPICSTNLFYKLVQSMGMGMNVTAQIELDARRGAITNILIG